MAKSKSNHEMAGGCLALFGLPFFAAGLFMSGLYFSGYAKWLESSRWHEVPCRIEAAELKVSRGDSTTYKATALYRYEFGGKIYQGDRVSFHAGSDNVGSFHQDVHRELSRHLENIPPEVESDPARASPASFRCYVNPADPSQSVLYRNLRWQMQAFMAIFALTFPAVGAGLMVAGISGARSLKREAALRSQHPQEPWKWKTEWQGESISETRGISKNAAHLYTLWSGLIIVPLIAAAAQTGAFQTDGTAWLLLIFVVLWVIPVSYSVKKLRHRLAIGKASFEPKDRPAWPGGVLRGNLLLDKPLPMRSTADVSLICERTTSRGSGDDRKTSVEKIWSDHQSIPQDLMIRDLAGFRLPIAFNIPGDAPESSFESGGEPKHTWKLELKVPATPIHSVFELPVFRTEKSPSPSAESAIAVDGDGKSRVLSIHDDSPGDLPKRLAENRIRAEFDLSGSPVSIHCPPCRHRSLLLFLFAFNLIWTAAAVFLIIQQAPWIFRVVWPVSATAIWLSILWSVLHQRTVTFESTGLLIRNRLGPIAWKGQFDKSRIIGFTHDSNMSSGNTSYYRVRLESVTGKKSTLADGIDGSSVASALIERLERWRKAR
jgi:hypothetical protein